MDPAIGPAGQHVLPIRGEQHPIQIALRLIECVEPQPISDTPQFHRLIGAGRSEHGARRIEGEIKNRPIVNRIGPDQRMVCHLP